MLLNKLISYRKVDKPCADAAIKALSAHLWYLTEELAPLALFSSQVPNETKQQMADMLLRLDKAMCSTRYGTGFGKTMFPTIDLNQILEVDYLTQLIGKDSGSFFSHKT